MPDIPEAMPRKFGVEIEFALHRGVTIGEVVSFLREQRIITQSHIDDWRSSSETNWILKRDGSLPGGGELVSPPLQFLDEGHRDQVTKAANALKEIGAMPVKEAGIHVHCESRHMTPKQISNLVRVFSKYEDCIYRIASSGWNTIRPGARQYCKPFSEQMMTRLSKASSDEQLRRAYYGDAQWHHHHGHFDNSRYYGLNIHSHFYRGTIEFRVFNSSVNAQRIQTYIAMCVAMMQYAEKKKGKTLNRRYALGSMKEGVSEEEKALFNFRQMLRYESGMSLEDYRNVIKFWKDSKPQGLIGRRN